MKSYYKIGEISKIYGIGKDSLMYYEELGILNPLRDKNGYRMYHISDIWRLNLIKELRTLDFPMKKIKEYLDERTVASTQDILNEEIKLINVKIKELLGHKENIESRLKAINEVIHDRNIDSIKVVDLPQRKALLLNGEIKRDEEFDFLLQKLHKEFEERFYILGNNSIGSEFNLEKLNQEIYSEFQSVFCLLEDQETLYNFTLPEGKYVVCQYTGAYTNNRKVIPRMFKFIKEKGFKVSGNPIELYKIDIHETGKESEFITEVQIPVKV